MAIQKISALRIKRIWRYYRRFLRLYWQAVKIKLLGFSIKFIPKEQQRVFILTLIIGVLCGLAAVAFHLMILKSESLLIDWVLNSSIGSKLLMIVLLPTIGGLLCGLLLNYIAPDADLRSTARTGRDFSAR